MVMFCPKAFEGFLCIRNTLQSDPFVHQNISGLQFTSEAVLAQATSKLIAGSDVYVQIALFGPIIWYNETQLHHVCVQWLLPANEVAGK